MTPTQSIYERLERQVQTWVKKGELNHAIDHCEETLASLKETEYHTALGRSWSRQVGELARWLGDFYRKTCKQFPVRALYCEMNRFEINAQQWSLAAFAYPFFGKPDNLGWMVGWKESTGGFVLRGMKDLQKLFARDYRGEPPRRITPSSDVVILLLTLRMLELVQTAARLARKNGGLPEDVPVLAAAHEAPPLCIFYGAVIPPVTLEEPARPVHRPLRAGAPLGIYKMDGGWDEFGNSLKWDLLDYVDERSYFRNNPLKLTKPLAHSWKPPRVTMRKRDWRCDLIDLFLHSAVNEKARAALEPLLGKSVEFLPLRCNEVSRFWVMHPLRYVDLGPRAVHNGQFGDNMTSIRKYDFNIDDLEGKHLFGIKQTPGSHSRGAGICFGNNYVSEEFRRVVIEYDLQGVVFEKVFSYRPAGFKKCRH
jgi:hypothetical protein